MEIKGKVHEIGAITNVSESFKKRDIIIVYAENPQYPEYISLQATQDRVTIFDNLSVGDEVEVSFNLRGRPWTNAEGKTTYLNSLVAWKVNKLASSSVSTQSYDSSVDLPVDFVTSGDDSDDGLPF